MIKQKGIIVLILLVIVLLVAYLFYTRYGAKNVIENFNTTSNLPTARYVWIGYEDKTYNNQYGDHKDLLCLQGVQIFDKNLVNIARDATINSNSREYKVGGASHASSPDHLINENYDNFQQHIGTNITILHQNNDNNDNRQAYVVIDLGDEVELSSIRLFGRPIQPHYFQGTFIKLFKKKKKNIDDFYNNKPIWQ